jgi:predicted PurR-regulated permease PerM
MLILGMASTILYLSLNIRYAYGLGVLTGLLNIIPVLGAAVSIVLAILVAAIDSWSRVLGVVIFFLIYVQIENSWLIPRIMKNRVQLPALAIFVALLLGSAVEGVVGALVAIPTAVQGFGVEPAAWDTRQVAHASWYLELCPVHRGFIAMSGSSGRILAELR